MNLREMAEAYIASPQFGSTSVLHEMLEDVARRSEQAAFEIAASRLLDFEMPLGAVACIRELAKERAEQ